VSYVGSTIGSIHVESRLGTGGMGEVAAQAAGPDMAAHAQVTLGRIEAARGDRAAAQDAWQQALDALAPCPRPLTSAAVGARVIVQADAPGEAGPVKSCKILRTMSQPARDGRHLHCKRPAQCPASWAMRLNFFGTGWDALLRGD